MGVKIGPLQIKIGDYDRPIFTGSFFLILGLILWEIKIKIDPMKIGLDFQRTDFHIPLQQLHFMGD